jgi:hypothetical protein
MVAAADALPALRKEKAPGWAGVGPQGRVGLERLLRNEKKNKWAAIMSGPNE